MDVRYKIRHFKTRSEFDNVVVNKDLEYPDNIYYNDIIFISDTLELYTHGKFYDCKTYNGYVVKSLLKTIVKEDILDDFGLVTLDDEDTESLIAAKLLNAVNNISADWITDGEISIERLPAGALERMYIYDNELTALSKYNSGDIQEGDMILVTENGDLMYYCIGDGSQSSKFSDVFKEFRARHAASVPWSGIIDMPEWVKNHGEDYKALRDIVETKYSKYGGELNGDLIRKSNDGSEASYSYDGVLFKNKISGDWYGGIKNENNYIAGLYIKDNDIEYYFYGGTKDAHAFSIYSDLSSRFYNSVTAPKFIGYLEGVSEDSNKLGGKESSYYASLSELNNKFTKNNIKSTLGISDWALASSLEWEAVNGRPTLLSQLTDDVVSGKYLSLSGGTVDGTVTIKPKNINALLLHSEKDVLIGFYPYSSDLICNIGASVEDAKAKITIGINRGDYQSISVKEGEDSPIYRRRYVDYVMLHSGNYSDYALPLSGGTIKSDNAPQIIIDTTSAIASGIRFMAKGVNNGFVGSNGTANEYGTYISNALTGCRIGVRNDGVPYYYDTAHRTLIHSGNIGEQSVASANTATNANKLNNLSSGAFTRRGVYPETSDSNWDINTGIYSTNAAANETLPLGYQGNHVIHCNWDPNAANQLFLAFDRDLFAFRRKHGNEWKEWKTVAFTDSNVASATKLETTHTIWGKNFDGSRDVGGDIQLTKGDRIMVVDGDVRRSLISMGSNNKCSFGYSATPEGYETMIYGNTILFRYGKDVGTAMVISSNGNVSIGASTPSEKLEVNGNVKAIDFITTSDNRLKTFIKDVDINFESLKTIPKKYYYWKDKSMGENLQIGTSAQELIKIYPECVSYNENEDKYSVNYQKLSIIALAAIDKLYDRIVELENKLKTWN